MNRDSIDSVIRSLRRVNLQGSFFGQTVAIRFGLSESDVEALEVLIDTGAATAGRLSELMGLTTGAVTRVIDRLEQGGYVQRVPDPTDRRRVIVELVPEKMSAVQATMARFGEKSAIEIGRYTDAELAVIDDFLTRMAEVTRDEANALRDVPDREPGGRSEFAAPIGGLDPGASPVPVRRERAAGPRLGRLRRPLPRQVRRTGPAGPVARRDRVDPVQGPLAVGLARSAGRGLAQHRHPVGRRGRRRVEQAPGQVHGGRPSIVRADRGGRPASPHPRPAVGRRPDPPHRRGEPCPFRTTGRRPRAAQDVGRRDRGRVRSPEARWSERPERSWRARAPPTRPTGS